MQVQYNFKIEESLKEAVEQALTNSEASNKSDFLAQMLSAYTAHQASNTPTGIDLSKYENVNQHAKDAVTNAFKHVLTLLDANFSTTTNEVIQFNEAQKALEAKELTYQNELEALQVNTTAELNTMNLDTKERIIKAENQTKELETKNQELEVSNTELQEKLKAINQLATQVQFITEENQRLRKSAKVLEDFTKNQKIEAEKSIKIFEKQLSNAKEISLNQEFELKTKVKEYQLLEKQLIEEKENNKLNVITQKEEFKLLNQKVSLSEAKLNQAIGKLELLDTQKPI